MINSVGADQRHHRRYRICHDDSACCRHRIGGRIGRPVGQCVGSRITTNRTGRCNQHRPVNRVGRRRAGICIYRSLFMIDGPVARYRDNWSRSVYRVTGGGAVTAATTAAGQKRQHHRTRNERLFQVERHI